MHFPYPDVNLLAVGSEVLNYYCVEITDFVCVEVTKFTLKGKI